jgi:hypothetical protein
VNVLWRTSELGQKGHASSQPLRRFANRRVCQLLGTPDALNLCALERTLDKEALSLVLDIG